MSSASSLAAKDVDLYDGVRDVDHDHLYDESCALLSHQQPVIESQVPQSKATPVPKLQLATLCFVRILEPIGFTQLFPYINEMIVNLNMISDPSKVGFVSGLVESTFAVFQMLSIYHWAKLSDAVGRRPVILVGAIGMGSMTLLFGLSQNLTSLMITRSLNGFFAGNIAVVQSVLGEISDSSNQAVTYPIYAMIWPLGAVMGPMLGGTFSDPATKYPGIFDFHFFRKYPYFFPCAIATMISGIGATFGYFFMEETLPSKKRQAGKSAVKSYGATESNESPVSVKLLLSIPIIRALITSGFALAFISSAFETVFVLFLYSPISIGGLAFNTSQIGYALSGAGVVSVMMQIFLMPVLLRRFDFAKMYRICMLFWFVPFIILPFLNLVARNGLAESGQMLPEVQAIIWAGVAVVVLVSRLCCLAYSFSMILIKENAPNSASLSATNGLVNVAMSFARVFSPAVSNSMFAAAVELDILGGNLWVVLLSVVAVVSSLCSVRVVAEKKKICG